MAILAEVPKGFVLLPDARAVKRVDAEKKVIHLRGKQGGRGQVKTIQVKLEEVPA